MLVKAEDASNLPGKAFCTMMIKGLRRRPVELHGQRSSPNCIMWCNCTFCKTKFLYLVTTYKPTIQLR